MPRPFIAFVAAALLALAGPAAAQVANPATNPHHVPGSPGSGNKVNTEPRAAWPSAPPTQAQVKENLEANGYTHIHDLRRTAEGWTAKAVRHGRSLSLRVGRTGRIERQ